MRLSASLSRYMALTFARQVALVFVAAFVLMLMIDVMELSRRGGDLDVPFSIIVAISAMRLPALAEQLVPFAILVGALMTLVTLSRRSELVVARASGVSAWQFLAPLIGVAAIFGLAATFIYNPLSANLKERSDATMAERFGGATANLDPDREIWFRQSIGDVMTLVRAAAATDGGRTLNQFSAMMFNAQGDFEQRVDSARATLGDGVWVLDTGTLTDAEGATRALSNFELPTPLTADDVSGRFTPANHVPIWALPGLAEKAQQAGLASDRYTFQFQALLARPLLLMAMVLVAATVSLRFSRHGGTTQLVVAGLSAGFIVFVLNEITGDLGGAGLVNPILAAWVPPFAAGLFGITALLHLEDG